MTIHESSLQILIFSSLCQVWNFAKKTIEFVRFLVHNNGEPYKFFGFLSKVSNLAPIKKQLKIRY
jgi:hypothetical protein